MCVRFVGIGLNVWDLWTYDKFYRSISGQLGPVVGLNRFRINEDRRLCVVGWDCMVGLDQDEIPIG